jgi:hypothetical protein
MFLFGAIFVLVICLFALAATFMLGVKQNKKHNQKYDQSRKKTVLLLGLIYLVAILLGAFFIFYFTSK